MNAAAYEDDEFIRMATQSIMNSGVSVLQSFWTDDDERVHSLNMLRAIGDVREGAHVVSLGCGIGGMERYWQHERPDLRFTFVNISGAQLEMCVADGKKVLADAQTFRPEEPADVVVVTHMLGHVDPSQTIRNAARMMPDGGGAILVSDVFDAGNEFKDALMYDAPSLEHVLDVAWSCSLSAEFPMLHMRVAPFFHELTGRLALDAAPAVIVLRNAGKAAQ